MKPSNVFYPSSASGAHNQKTKFSFVLAGTALPISTKHMKRNSQIPGFLNLTIAHLQLLKGIFGIFKIS
jgi:hypothetical protein